MDEITFKLIKTHVADYYNDNHCLVMLKVLFKDHIEPQKLSKITDTINLLNALYEKSLLSCKDLALLYNAIKLTGHFALQDKIKATWTSFPDVREIAVTEFTEHRQKLMRFGQQVIQTDVRRIDGLYNTPTKNYKDSWEMIHNLEDKNIIKEDMTDFIAKLKQLDLPKAVDALERPIQGPDAVAPDVIPATPTTELDEDDFNELLTEVSDWWRDHGNIHMLRVLLSEFTTRDKTITLFKIEKTNTTFELLGLLKASGLLKPTDIDILVEVTNLCGLQGVHEAIAKTVKSPNFDVPYKNFSDHRRKLIALGQQMKTDNMLTIGQLKGIKVNDDTDPFLLILQLEKKGLLAEGEKIEKFIEQMTRYGMTYEVEALTKLSGKPTGKHVPVEILARGPETLRAFNAALEEGKTKFNQGRTIFVGLERVGKTSTINSLLQKDFDPESEITDAMVKTTVCTSDLDNATLKETSKNTSSEFFENAIADATVNALRSARHKEESSAAVSTTKQEFENISNLMSNSGKEEPTVKLEKPHIPEEIEENPEFPKEGSKPQIEKPQMSEEIRKKVEMKLQFQRQGSGSQMDGNNFVMNIWDFGGQPIYHVIQRIFMVSFAVVCVVFNLNEDLDAPAYVLDPTTGKKYKHRMTNLEFILYWIRSVYINARVGANVLQKIMLIGTHFDSLGNEDEKKTKVKEITDKIWHALEDKLYWDLVFQHKIFTIENSLPFAESNAREIICQIQSLAKNMIQFLPIKWLQVLQELQQLGKDNLYLPTSQIIDLLDRCKITNKKLLLEYLHDIGEILYYPDDEVLKDKIVLDLMGVVEKFKTIITVKDPKLQSSLKKLWKMLNSGKLEEELLRHIWKKDSGVMIEFFVTLMQRFGLMCEKKTKKGRTFYVLSRLRPQRDDTKDVEYEEKRAISLFHDFDGYLPDDLFQRAATKFIEEFQMEYVEPRLSYEHVEVDIDSDHFVILNITTINNDRLFKTTIVSRNDDDEPLPRVCKNVLSFLEKELRVLSENGARGVEVKMYIPGCVHCSKMHFVRKFDEDKLVCGRKTMDVTHYRKLFRETEGHGATGVAHGEATGTPNELTSMTELTEDNFNKLLTDVCDWWVKHGSINMLRVLLSEFTRHHNTITLHTIEEAKTPFELIDLLEGPGLLKPADIGILVEATNICGLQGVQDVIAKTVKLPNSKDVQYKHFSEHRRKLIAFGHQVNKDNKIRIGRLKGIRPRVNEDTDPFWLILKLEMKGTVDEGKEMDTFIELLTRYGMTKEVEALTNLL